MNAEELEDRLVTFAVRIGNLVDALPETRMGRHIAGQLVRCGTSPAPNYAEACAGESRDDFIHKISIVLKELRETRIWIKLILRGGLLPDERIADALNECDQLCNLFGQSVATARANRGRKKSSPSSQFAI